MIENLLFLFGGFLLGVAICMGRWFYLIYFQKTRFQQVFVDYLRERGWTVTKENSP